MAEKNNESSGTPGVNGTDGILKQMENAVPHGSSSGSDERPAEKPKPQQPEQKAEAKPSKLKQLWEKLGIDK